MKRDVITIIRKNVFIIDIYVIDLIIKLREFVIAAIFITRNIHYIKPVLIYNIREYHYFPAYYFL